MGSSSVFLGSSELQSMFRLFYLRSVGVGKGMAFA